MTGAGITIQVEGLVATCVAIGFAIPVAFAAVSGGYILAVFAIDRFARTVLGIHLRRFFCRIAPSKFFGDDYLTERGFVEKVVARAIVSGRLDKVIEQVKAHG